VLSDGMRLRHVVIGVCLITAVTVGIVVLRRCLPKQITPIAEVVKNRSKPPALAQDKGTSVLTPIDPETGKPSVLSPHGQERSLIRRTPVPIVLPADVSEGVRLIVGQTSQKDYTVRAAAVRVLGGNLSRADIGGLYAFLRSGGRSHPELDELSLGALKNDVLQVLIAQEIIPSDLLPAILEMYRDPEMDILWRDYCLQHVSLYYERRWKPDNAKRLDDPDRLEALKAFAEALDSHDKWLAGTALLGLARLSEVYPEIDRAKVAERSLESALNEQEEPATRITAVGVCGLLGKAEVLPIARILAQTGESTPLRLSAIGTIGLLGVTDDLELMQSLADGRDVVMKKAAQMAVKRIKMRAQK